MYDLIIIGASAAGIPAAIYAARRHLNVLIITKDIGGEMALSGEVNNWPGIKKISGFELARQFYDHAKSYNVPIEEGIEATDIKQAGKHHIVLTKNGKGEEKKYETKTVLITSGIHPREMNIQGEREFKGKGVTYCTVCDGPLFRGKITATVGAGNSALESALMMSEVAKKVYIISRYPNTKEFLGGFPRGETVLVSKVKNAKNIEVIYDAEVQAVTGTNFVTGLVYKENKNGKTKEIKIDGVMAHIGTVPNSDFVTCVTKNKQKEIQTDIHGKTSMPGIFAAGDVTDVPFKQIVIAAGQGVTAALSAIEYINLWSE